MDSLRRYIAARTRRDDVLFLGIFERRNVRHVGNIKYEPLNRAQRFAVMGIMIGERRWRGRGIAEEVIRASARWLSKVLGIRDILLGVACENKAAIAAYGKIGFKARRDRRLQVQCGAMCMVWRVQTRAARPAASCGAYA